MFLLFEDDEGTWFVNGRIVLARSEEAFDAYLTFLEEGEGEEEVQEYIERGEIIFLYPQDVIDMLNKR